MINEIVFQGKQLALSEEAIVNIEKCRKYLDDKMKSMNEAEYRWLKISGLLTEEEDEDEDEESDHNF